MIKKTVGIVFSYATVLLIGLAFTDAVIQAQVIQTEPNGVEVTTTSTDVEVNATTSTQATLLKDQYQNDLISYQAAEKSYLQAKQQYQQFNTLSSQQEAIAATVSAMRARSKVMRSYLNLLLDQLNTNQGISGANASQSQSLIIPLLNELEMHELNLASVRSSDQLNASIQEFELLYPRYELAVAFGKQLNQLGLLQSAHTATEQGFYYLETEVVTSESSSSQQQFDTLLKETTPSRVFVLESLLALSSNLSNLNQTSAREIVSSTNVQYDELYPEIIRNYENLSELVRFLEAR